MSPLGNDPLSSLPENPEESPQNLGDLPKIQQVALSHLSLPLSVNSQEGMKPSIGSVGEFQEDRRIRGVASASLENTDAKSLSGLLAVVAPNPMADSPLLKFDLSKGLHDVSYTDTGSFHLVDLQDVITRLYRLSKCEQALPLKYRNGVLLSFINFLEENENARTNWDKKKWHEKNIVDQYLGAFFQRMRPNHVDVPSLLTDLLGLQALITNTYGFSLEALKKHSEKEVFPPPPLAKWGAENAVLQTFCVKDMNSGLPIKINVSLVVFPEKYRKGGIYAWSVLSHEVGGHSVLDICPEIIGEWREAIKTAVFGLFRSTDILKRLEEEDRDQVQKEFGEDYWSDELRLEEVAADILGLLTSGPAFGIGSIGYHKREDKHLKCTASDKSKHPPDILRAFAISKCMQLLEFKEQYQACILEEILKQIPKGIAEGKIIFEGKSSDLDIPLDIARFIVECVAQTILEVPLKSLKSKPLKDLIKWEDTDERYVEILQKALEGNEMIELSPDIEFPARHVISAAVLAVSKTDSDPEKIFERMKKCLVSIWNSINK